MKRKSVIEAVAVAAAIMGLYGCAQENADTGIGIISTETVATEEMGAESAGMQENTEDEVIDYTGRDAQAAEADEGGDTQYVTEAFSEEGWEDSYEQDFYERHKNMDYDEDGEITVYEELRWDFIHADLEAEIADLKPMDQQILYLGTYVSAYMEIMGLDQSESVPLMEQADQLDAVYAQMCSDRNMTMDELEEIFETDLRGRIQEIRESDPNYWGDAADNMEYWNPTK